MAATLKLLREKRKKSWEDAKKFHEERTKDGKALTTEDRAKWGEMNAAIDAQATEIADAERIEEMNRSMGDPVGGSRQLPGREDDDGGREDRGTDDVGLGIQAWLKSTANSLPEISEEEKSAAQRAKITLGAKEIELRMGGSRDLRSARFGPYAEKRDQSINLPTTGGYLRPEGFIPRIERALLMFGGMRQVAEILRTENGNPLPWPTGDDTGNEGAAIDESTAAGTTDVTFGAFVLGAAKTSSKFVKVPHELLEDAGVDVAGYVADALGERLARTQNRECTTGVIPGRAKGLTIASTAAFTSAAATAIAPDELKALEHSVDASYRQKPGVGFMMNDGILAYIRTLKDGQGRYLFDVERVQGGLGGAVGSYAGGSVGYLLDGYPCYLNNSMAAAHATTRLPVTATISIEFGDLSAYKIREVRGIRLLRLMERFADADQEGFIAFLRYDGGLLDAGTHPVKHLLQA